MALTSTTLAAACTKEATSLILTSATGTSAGNFIRVNDEFVYVQSITGTTIEVQRGRWGTNARAHGILSIAVTGLAADFAPDTHVSHMYTYGVSGALTPKPGIHRLSKAGVGAMTLVAPTADQEGIEMTIISTTAQAHTVTLGSGYFNGATNTKGTFGGAIGDVIKLIVIGGYWCVTLNKNITLAAS